MHCQIFWFLDFCHNRFGTLKENRVPNQDIDSKLGSYLVVNPDLKMPNHQEKLEFQRTCITRYRTGSHNLLIEKGRKNPFIEREARLCKCNNGIQTIKHVIMNCHLLNEIRTEYAVDDIPSGISNENFLIEMEKILDIKA